MAGLAQFIKVPFSRSIWEFEFAPQGSGKSLSNHRITNLQNPLKSTAVRYKQVCKVDCSFIGMIYLV